MKVTNTVCESLYDMRISLQFQHHRYEQTGRCFSQQCRRCWFCNEFRARAR